VFEFLLVEWHLTPEYIIDNWTDEKFDLMVSKLFDRKIKEKEAIEGKQTNKVSEEQLFRMPGIKHIRNK